MHLHGSLHRPLRCPGLRASQNRTRCQLFGWGSKSAKDPAPAADTPDADLPFPRELLQDTFLAGKGVTCGYRATEHGFSALAFHSRMDFKGPVLIVARTDSGLRFGGFNPTGFASSDDYSASHKAFLCVWEAGAPLHDMPIVLGKVGGDEAAVFDYARGGPQWGADALRIGEPQSAVMGGITGVGDSESLAAGELTSATCRLGLSYALMPDGSDSLFGDTKRVQLEEVEAFYCPAIAALY